VPEASAERLGIGGKREAPPQKAKQTRAICSRAQQPAMPVIGVLYGVSAAEWAELMTGFRRGLSEMGFVECRNIAIEYRWAEGRFDRMPAMATDLVGRKVAVILTGGYTRACGR
jgi:putative ABC transport system substrate-binding protein